MTSPKFSLGYWTSIGIALLAWIGHTELFVFLILFPAILAGTGRTSTPSRTTLVLAIARLFDGRCCLFTCCPLALKPGFSTRNIDGRTNNKDRARQYPNIG